MQSHRLIFHLLIFFLKWMDVVAQSVLACFEAEKSKKILMLFVVMGDAEHMKVYRSTSDLYATSYKHFVLSVEMSSSF